MFVEIQCLELLASQTHQILRAELLQTLLGVVGKTVLHLFPFLLLQILRVELQILKAELQILKAELQILRVELQILRVELQILRVELQILKAVLVLMVGRTLLGVVEKTVLHLFPFPLLQSLEAVQILAGDFA